MSGLHFGSLERPGRLDAALGGWAPWVSTEEDRRIAAREQAAALYRLFPPESRELPFRHDPGKNRSRVKVYWVPVAQSLYLHSGRGPLAIASALGISRMRVIEALAPVWRGTPGEWSDYHQVESGRKRDVDQRYLQTKRVKRSEQML